MSILLKETSKIISELKKSYTTFFNRTSFFSKIFFRTIFVFHFEDFFFERFFSVIVFSNISFSDKIKIISLKKKIPFKIKKLI